jgi:hypothetical protein
MKMAVFQCKKCGQPFEKDGVHAIVHDRTAGRVCPECVANAETITVIIGREAPGKPYVIQHVEVALHDETHVKNGVYVVKEGE